MSLFEELEQQGLQPGNQDHLQGLLARIPYAQFMGLELEQQGDEIVTVLPFSDQLVGNVNLPAIHGGAVGAMLEMTAILQLLHDTACERMPKTVDVSFDYLRSAQAKTTYGRAIVTRRGRRVANVRCELWQDQRAKPVAASHGHFMLTTQGAAPPT